MKTGDIVVFAPRDPADARRWRTRREFIKVPGSGRPASQAPVPTDFRYVPLHGDFHINVEHGRYTLVDWEDMHNADDEEVRIVDD